jgi:hypothetical protein
MRGLLQALTALCLCLAVTGCNTTDALTPKADVPNADNTQMSDNTDRSERRPAEERKRYPKIDEDSTSQATDDGPAPQNTLEAQQQAMQRGDRNPSLTAPDTTMVANKDASDDTSQQATTTLSANLYRTNSDTKPASNIYSTASGKDTIRFLPIIGAPVAAVTPLSRELGNSARSSGLIIKGSSDQTAQHVLKGYLSAFADGKTITVVYVWDILDNAGSRLHRIQGQQTVPGKGSDAWSSVPPEVMAQIGSATIAEYMQWLQSQSQAAQ